MKRVRPTPDFYEQLASYLPADRGSDGTPSRHDFESHDLFDIIARFAHEWDDLPQAVPGRDDYRMVLGAGETVASYIAVGQLAPDGSVEIDLVVHPDFLADPDQDDDQAQAPPGARRITSLVSSDAVSATRAQPGAG